MESGSTASAEASRILRQGVAVDFSATAAYSPGPGRNEVMEGNHAEFTFRITSAEDGKPVSGIYPGVWVDLAQRHETAGGVIERSCKDRVSTYLQGVVGMRPMIDLNSYFVLVMNADSTISVIDPLVGVTGITNLYATIILPRPGADWAKSTDDHWLYVSMPRANKLAVVDLNTFKVDQSIKAGDNPIRVRIQPDQKYIWVGNDARPGKTGGVTVIDRETRWIAAEIHTGKGHHEIAFSADSRYAYITNRDDGTVSIIDVARLEKLKDIETGPMPISLAFSPLSQALYVADGQSGVVSVIDKDRQAVVARMEANPGLGPLGFTSDGRYGLVANPAEDTVYVFDSSTNRLLHAIPVDDEPYQIAFSRTYAYVRSLGSEQVSMIDLRDLAKDTQPPIKKIAIGHTAPGKASALTLGSAIVPSAQESSVLVVSPADATVYFYMEGMNATSGAFRNYGHAPRAVEIANRALKEVEPGVYKAKVRVPAVSGTYEVAFLMDTPRFLHCFELQVAKNPELKKILAPLDIQYLNQKRRVNAGYPLTLRFKLSDPETEGPRDGLQDVGVAYYKAPAGRRVEIPAKGVGGGVYEADLVLPQRGAYYVYVGVPSVGVRYADLPFLSLVALRQPSAPSSLDSTAP